MRTILRLFTKDDCYPGVDLALIDIDPKKLLDLREKVSSLFDEQGFYSASFFDYTPQPFNGESAGIENDGSDQYDVPDEFDIENVVEKDNFRLDASTIRVKNNGVLWHFYEKYSNSSFETSILSWEEIERAYLNELISSEN